MARVAARRARRTARQWWYRRAFGVSERELLGAFGVPDVQRLPQAALAPRPEAWCDVSRRESTVATLLELHSAAERAWARAERCLSRTYPIFERELSFGSGGEVDWAADPTSGHRYPNLPAAELELAPPGVDPKYPWQLARLDAVIVLGQGYWLASADEEKTRFAEEFCALVLDFFDKNPVNVGIHWTCAMEVALRAANLAQALYMMRDAPAVRAPEFLVPTLRALADHTAFVEANLEDGGRVPNNHLIADYVGLLTVASLFPRLPGASRQASLAVRGLREELVRQVRADGVSFEGSTGYHRLVAELGVCAVLAARTCGADLGTAAVRRVEGLLHAPLHWCSEFGLAPQIGDNDSGRALALTDRPSLDHGYLPNLGAALFASAKMRRQGEELCDEAAWLLGDEGLRTFRKLQPDAAPRSFTSPTGGLHVLRGNGAVVTLSAGPQGQNGAGGHSHNDKLSFELHLDGQPVIMDPGSPVYASDPEQRNRFRASGAHNGVEIDGLEQADFDPSRLFALPEGARSRVERFDMGPEVDRLWAVHHGYERLSDPVTVRRVLSLDKSMRALVVEELVDGARTHDLRINLQLPDAEVRLRGPRGGERLRAMEVSGGVPLDESLAVELGPRRSPRAVILVEPGVEVTLEQSDCARGYGERQRAVRVALRARRQLPARLRWVVLFG